MNRMVIPPITTAAIPNNFKIQGLDATAGLKNESQGKGMSPGLQAGLGALTGIAGSIGVSEQNKRGLYDVLDPVHQLAGGRESGVGNVLGDAGVGVFQAGVQSGNPFLMAGGAGLKIIGGLTNAAFGIKANQELLNAANNSIDTNRNFVSDVDSYDDIKDIAGKTSTDVYEGGWFSGGKASRKNRELQQRMDEAYSWADRSVGNNIDNIRNNNMDIAKSNYFAFGGPVGGAIDYGFMSDLLSDYSQPIEGGNGLGKVPRLNTFAFGGARHSNGADWNTGVTMIDNGGSHEANPFGGVPMGVAPDGQPNLVEEGEVVYNDYVFSNRIKVPKSVQERYKLKGKKGMTFAEAAKKAQKESEERPNDPISKRGLEDIMGKLMGEQETIRQKKREREQKEAIAEQNEILGSVFAEGGSISIKPSKRGTFTAAATKHGMGVQEFASEVLSNPDKYSPKMRQKANFARNASGWKHALGGHLFDSDDNIMSQFTQYLNPVDTLVANPQPEVVPEQPSTPTLDTSKPFLPQLAAIKTVQRNDGSTVYATDNNTKLALIPSNNAPNYSFGDDKKVNWGDYVPYLRYAPALGAGIGVFSDLMGWTNSPDYSGVGSILAAADRAGKKVNYTPIGDYMKYTPLDRLFYANQTGAQASATRNAIRNLSSGNNGALTARLLAADYNAQTNLGKLYRAAEEDNLAQREKVAKFNRETNEFNAEGDLKAQIASKDADRYTLEAAIQAATLRDKIDSRVSAARSANLTNLFDNLGNIGIDAYNRRDRDMLIRAGVYGTLSEKPQDWSDERWQAYRKALTGEGYKNGGKLNKKRGITI